MKEEYPQDTSHYVYQDKDWKWTKSMVIKMIRTNIENVENYLYRRFSSEFLSFVDEFKEVACYAVS